MNASREAPGLVLFLDGIVEGQTELVVDVAAATLALRDQYCEFRWPVHVALHVWRVAETYTIAGTAATRVAAECCRCLAPAEAGVEAPIGLVLQRRPAAAEELAAASAEDGIELVAPGTQEFDLSEIVRQALVLELPVRLYCRADCRGLCPRCGQNLNEGSCGCADRGADGRWDALGRIQFD